MTKQQSNLKEVIVQGEQIPIQRQVGGKQEGVVLGVVFLHIRAMDMTLELVAVDDRNLLRMLVRAVMLCNI